MAIVKMSKFTLFTFKSHKAQLLDRLQKFERVQFSDLNEEREEEIEYFRSFSQDEEINKLSEDLVKINFCMQALNPYIEKEGALEALKRGKLTLSYEQLKERYEKSNWHNIYDDLKSKDNALNECKNSINKLKGEIDSLLPWENLDVSFKDLKFAGVTAFIGTIPKAFLENFKKDLDEKISYNYLEVVSEVKGESFILLLVHKDLEEKAYDLLKQNSFSKVSMPYDGKPSDEIKEIIKEINRLKDKELSIKEEFKKMAIHEENIKIAYEYLLNLKGRAEATETFLNSEKLMMIDGWFPTEDEEKLNIIIKEITNNTYYMETSPAEIDDPSVPILLKNNKVVSAFEPITSMFSLPKYNELDPTPLLTPFYLVFFGMMLADMGYAILMFLGSLYALKKFKLDEGQEGFARFFLYLSFPTAFAGFVYGSFFGDIIKLTPILDTSKDVITILLISIGFGVVQIYTGLGIKGYMLLRQGLVKDAIYDVVSWYLALTGGILLIASGSLGMSPGAVFVCKWVMIVGMVMIVLTQGRQNKSIGAKLGGGLYALYGISGYVGDLVSYSRLMALGLAGGFIGSAFNLMISMFGNPIVKIIFGTLIFVAGHLFNLFLSALGAYVHTCRLQYVEYFGKFYEGGGKPFNPFKSKNKFINVKKN